MTTIFGDVTRERRGDVIKEERAERDVTCLLKNLALMAMGCLGSLPLPSTCARVTHFGSHFPNAHRIADPTHTLSLPSAHRFVRREPQLHTRC